MEKILKDKIFISTRPENSSDELSELFANAGATLLEMPLIKIYPEKLNTSEKETIADLGKFQWIIFTSANGVKYFFEHLKKENIPQLPASLKIAVIGKKTEKLLNDFGYQTSFNNPGITGENFAAAFIEKIKNSNTKPNVLLALGNIARTVIQDQIAEYANCCRINVYQTTMPESVDQKVLEQIENDNYEILLFTSPSGINNFLSLSDKLQKENLRFACIGETTANEALKNNITPKVIAKNSTALGLFESILDYCKKTIKKTHA